MSTLGTIAVTHTAKEIPMGLSDVKKTFYIIKNVVKSYMVFKVFLTEHFLNECLPFHPMFQQRYWNKQYRNLMKYTT